MLLFYITILNFICDLDFMIYLTRNRSDVFKITFAPRILGGISFNYDAINLNIFNHLCRIKRRICAMVRAPIEAQGSRVPFPY